jgi:hypothetical protein
VVRGAALVLLAFVSSGAAGAQTSGDTWAPLRFVVGTWSSASSGQPGNGTGTREYRFVLRDQALQVTNTATYPPQEKNPKGEVHEDAGYITYDKARKAFVYRQFHGEGFVNTYVSESVSPGEIVFVSEAIENIPPGWRARETYRRVSDVDWREVFELAEPGKAFEIYSETRLKRSR